MARALLIPLLTFLLLPRIGLAQQATDSAGVVRSIRGALDGWVEAANRQDWRTAARVWAPDLVGWYPGQPDDTYAKEMEQAANPKPGRPKTRYEVKVEEVMVSGPLAVVRDIWRFTTAPGTPDSSIAVVRGFEVWRRQADGSWKISRWISAPEPAKNPGAQARSPGNRYINPPGLVKPTGYTHVVVAADGRTVYVAGQVAFDSAGKVVGEADFKAQADQVYGNLRRALASVGASFSDLVKTTTLITDVKNVPALREIRTRYLDPRHPPANTLIIAALVRPELLLEIEAVAVIP